MASILRLVSPSTHSAV